MPEFEIVHIEEIVGMACVGMGMRKYIIISNLAPVSLRTIFHWPPIHPEGECEVAVFSAKRWDRRNRADLIESATPCHDAHVVRSYRVSNPLRLTVLASKSEDYTTAPQYLIQSIPFSILVPSKCLFA